MKANVHWREIANKGSTLDRAKDSIKHMQRNNYREWPTLDWRYLHVIQNPSSSSSSQSFALIYIKTLTYILNPNLHCPWKSNGLIGRRRKSRRRRVWVTSIMINLRLIIVNNKILDFNVVHWNHFSTMCIDKHKY